jgi:two-component system LytT family response regulator
MSAFPFQHRNPPVIPAHDRMKLSVLVVDDEPVARRRLKRFLLKSGDVRGVGECEDGAGAIRAIQQQDLDVVFLDVQMPNQNGFEVVRAVGPERVPALIFVTAFDQFALQAFEAQAIDYLLKPFGEERVRRALARARVFLQGSERRSFQERLTSLLATTGPGRRRILSARPWPKWKRGWLRRALSESTVRGWSTSIASKSFVLCFTGNRWWF